MQCLSLTAVCSLAPFGMLLTQVPRMCTAHLSLRENRDAHGRMDHAPCWQLNRELEVMDIHTNKLLTLRNYLML